MDYEAFLQSKVIRHKNSGFDIQEDEINPMLFDWQKMVVKWAVNLGKAALFAECGLGKTPMQLEWGRIIAEHVNGKVILLAPLAVAHQTVREGRKFGIPAIYCRSQEQADNAAESIIVANYEMLEHFDASKYAGVILDESSILKAFSGTTRKLIQSTFEHVPYKLACTATPAPNDHLELGNHAEFLNIMPGSEMISRWFINDTMEAGGYRLKRHAIKDYWRWVTSWAVCISTPSDLGYPNNSFALPELIINEHVVKVDQTRAFAQEDKYGQRRIILDATQSATSMWKEKKETAYDRCSKAKEIIGDDSTEPWLIWCDTNVEADILKEMFPQAAEVRGSDSIAHKEKWLNAFSDEEVQIMITKADIAGFGLNWQHCTNQVFVGVTYSFEKTYQALRRSWRFGVKKPVTAHMILAESESGIMQTLKRKQGEFKEMQSQMNVAMREVGLVRETDFRETRIDIENNQANGKNWEMHLGDCVQISRQLKDDSIDFSIYSPPFSTLYIYSDSIADMGNTQNHEEFFAQYDFLVEQLYRTIKPNGYVAVHCKDLPLYMNRDGAAGLYDFPGDLIRSHEKYGFSYVRWATVWKDPVIEMQRTKNHGLLWRNFSIRGEVVRQGMADFVLVFQKTAKPSMKIPSQLNNAPLDLIRRSVDLWTNPGESIILPQYAPLNLDGRITTGLNSHQVAFSFFDALSVTPETAQQIYSVTKPGRITVIRTMDESFTNGTKKNSAMNIIETMKNVGFTFHSRCAFTDGSSFVAFRKWNNEMEPEQVKNKPTGYIGSNPPLYSDSQRDLSIQIWQKYASPIWNDVSPVTKSQDCWFDVDQTNVLNFRIARDNADEKHICTLQLDLIHKCIRQYSKKNELVFSPFSGVGSEGVVAIKEGRKFIGSELKKSYFNYAVKYLKEAEFQSRQPTIFDID